LRLRCITRLHSLIVSGLLAAACAPPSVDHASRHDDSTEGPSSSTKNNTKNTQTGADQSSVSTAAPPHCDAAESPRLQAALAGAVASGTNAVLALKNEACGFRFFSTGPAGVDETKLHRVGSSTKTYVAGVILSLVREGRMSLDDRVSTWIPELPNSQIMTVRQVLNHTAGIFATDEEKDKELGGPET